MTRSRRLLLAAAALAGYAAAFALAHALVQLRYRWADPADVAASGGMYAFGDLIMELALVGILSLPPTWVLLRALREAEGLWRALSWTGLCWAALAPAGVAVLAAAAAWPAAVGSAPAPALRVADALSVLRLVAAPASLPGLAVAWWACGHEASRRRLRWAVVLEGAGAGACVLWIAWALLRARA